MIEVAEIKGFSVNHHTDSNNPNPDISKLIWFDTEFFDDGTTVHVVSIGLVRGDGTTYYAEVEETDLDLLDDWMKENVVPHLKGPIKPRETIAREIAEFAGSKPEFWAYVASYDWFALTKLYGTLLQRPDGWPTFCRDGRHFRSMLGDPKLPEHTGDAHDALSDALWLKTAFEFMLKMSKSTSLKIA